jgi:outer membrane protein OmpA-like peptidoglycan-associated protein
LSAHPNILNDLDDTPIATSGNYVAFPLNSPDDLEADRGEDERENLMKVGIASFPTRGVFAEAMLGHCNACEVRDVTRFWKWEESPCEAAPSIADIAPGPRGQTPSVTPSNMPAPVVQIAQTPSAPDPIGLAAALRVLGTPDIFRDMSGLTEVSRLLDTLANGPVSSMQDAQRLAREAQTRLRAEQVRGLPDGSRAVPKQTPSERNDNLQVARQAAETASALGIPLEGQQRIFENVLGTGFAPDTAANIATTLRESGPNWDRMERQFAITFPGLIAYLPGPWDTARDIALWNFDVDSADLGRFEDVLQNFGSFFEDWRDRGFSADIIGVASVSGSPTYNEQLSFDRAVAVSNMYHQRFQMPAARLNVRHIGARISPPPADVLDMFGDNELTWRAWNRRVELHAIPEPWIAATFDQIIAVLGTAAAPVRNQSERDRAIQLSQLLKSGQTDDLHIFSFSALLRDLTALWTTNAQSANQQMLNTWLLDPNRWDRFSFAGHMREQLARVVQPTAANQLLTTRVVEMLRAMHQAWGELDRYVTIQQSGASGAAIHVVMQRVYTWTGEQIDNDDSVYSVLRAP